ncbi:MAG: restriction endonuclease [Porphyromonadaceae bacterium]|nr:MAG: restriction endonuclease [Porphyromonadaceae bacterium]
MLSNFKIDKMTPQEFEQYVSERYQELGYKTILTPYSGDWGIDVIATEGKREKSLYRQKCMAALLGKSTVRS